jgi:hypothetical protein
MSKEPRMMTVVGSSFMAMAPRIKAATAILCNFLSTLPVPGRVWDEKRALARPDHGEDQPLEPARLIMRKQSDQQPEPSATLAVLLTLFYRTRCGGKHDVVQRR